MTTATCVNPACDGAAAEGRAFCDKCWWTIPEAVRDRVLRSKLRNGVGSWQYRDAMEKAREAVER